MKSKSLQERKCGDLLLEETPQRGGSDAMGTKLDNGETVSLKDRIREKKIEVERSVLIQALRKTGGNKAEAARLLQINYSTIHLKIKRYGIRLKP
jgi:two-component system nitrogen regulation response regulator GlnG